MKRTKTLARRSPPVPISDYAAALAQLHPQHPLLRFFGFEACESRSVNGIRRAHKSARPLRAVVASWWKSGAPHLSVLRLIRNEPPKH